MCPRQSYASPWRPGEALLAAAADAAAARYDQTHERGGNEGTAMPVGTEDLKAQLTAISQRIHDFRGRL